MKIERNNKQFSNYYNGNRSNNITIPWIESLLQSPLSGYRKRCLWKILAPYLMNVRKLSYDESFSIMMDWLDKCNQVQRLDFNAKSKVKETLAGVGNYYPIGLDKLKQEIKELYDDIIISL